MIHGTVHGPGYAGDSPFTSTYTLPGGVPFSGDYHVYAISWTPDSITFFVDEHAYYRTSIRELPSGTNWVFNHPFFLLLNVAVGGGWPGDPNQTSTFPQNMLVDYVRVYAIEPGL